MYNKIETDEHHQYIDHLILLYKDNKIIENIENKIKYYRTRLACSIVFNHLDSLDYKIKELLSYMDKDLLFVYGTLMSDEISHYMLENALYIGDGCLNGYGLLELDGYPGMINMDSYVAGEVYKINSDIKYKLDLYEEDEYTYESDYMIINNLAYYVHFYKYILEDHREYKYSCTRNGRWIDVNKKG